jgi:hypothetical protein
MSQAVEYDDRCSVQVAKEVRAALNAARKSGRIDRGFEFRVRIDDSTTHQDVNIRMVGAATPDEFLFSYGPDLDDFGQPRRRWSDAATALTGLVRDVIAPVVRDWDDGRYRFITLGFKDGMGAP